MVTKAVNPELKKYMDKKVFVTMNANRKVSGVLRGYDPFMNITLEDAFEVSSNNENKPLGSVVIRGNSITVVEALERIQ